MMIDSALSRKRRLGIAGLVFLTTALVVAAFSSLPAAGQSVAQAVGLLTGRVSTNQGERLVYAVEATRVIISDEGTANLVNGRAVVPIDSLYAQAVSLPAGYQVFLTPLSANTAGLAVVNESATSFEVRELNKGRGSFNFHWRIDGLRRGFERTRLEVAPAVPAPPAVPPAPVAPPAAPPRPPEKGQSPPVPAAPAINNQPAGTGQAP